MSRFEALVMAIRSGQLSEQQVAIELSEPVFAAYYRQRFGGISVDKVAWAWKPQPKSSAT